MFRFPGVKLNFASGMASAASTSSFSTLVMSRSTDEATVGGVCGAGDALAFVALFAPCPSAVNVKPSDGSRQQSRDGLMRMNLLITFQVSVLAVVAFHGIEQLSGVVADTVFEDDLDVLDVRDVDGRIAFHHHEIGVLPGRNRADPILAAEKARAVQRRDANGLDRREPRF